MGSHALLSPSAAHRWLNCTAAPRIEERFPDSGSSYAEEGTLAHAYCARHLKAFLGLPTCNEDTEIGMLGQYHTGEMDEYTALYRDIVLEKLAEARGKTADAVLLVEQRLDFTKWVPESFGTADAVIIADGTMEVIDFKYGKGVRVEAEGNPQMMIYALGAYEAFCFEYDIREVRMTIVQPRIDNFSTASVQVEHLIDWAGTTLAPKAREAYGGGRQKPGEWCRFCKAKAVCKSLANMAVTTAHQYSDPRMFSDKTLAENVLPMLDTIRTWLAGVEEYALEKALSGTKFNGYKLVAGRSIRRITDTEAAMRALRAEFPDEDVFMRPRELRTITDLEKAIGKKRFNELCGNFITKPEGKPKLVPESDKRPPLDLDTDPFKGIELTE